MFIRSSLWKSPLPIYQQATATTLCQIIFPFSFALPTKSQMHSSGLSGLSLANCWPEAIGKCKPDTGQQRFLPYSMSLAKPLVQRSWSPAPAQAQQVQSSFEEGLRASSQSRRISVRLRIPVDAFISRPSASSHNLRQGAETNVCIERGARVPHRVRWTNQNL